MLGNSSNSNDKQLEKLLKDFFEKVRKNEKTSKGVYLNGTYQFEGMTFYALYISKFALSHTIPYYMLRFLQSKDDSWKYPAFPALQYRLIKESGIKELAILYGKPRFYDYRGSKKMEESPYGNSNYFLPEEQWKKLFFNKDKPYASLINKKRWPDTIKSDDHCYEGFVYNKIPFVNNDNIDECAKALKDVFQDYERLINPRTLSYVSNDPQTQIKQKFVNPESHILTEKTGEEVKKLDNLNQANTQIETKPAKKLLDESTENDLRDDSEDMIELVKTFNKIQIAADDRIVKPMPKPAKRINGENKGKYIRDPKNKYIAMENAKFSCEVDSEHETFISENTEKNYVEAHHLIPMKYQDNFNKSIDNFVNIISLCPNCHRKFHLGQFEDKEILIEKFHEERKEHLEQAKIFVALDKLKDYYK